MATLALTNCTIFVHDTDLTAVSNKAALKTSVAELDVTPFGSSYRQRIGGLKTVGLDVSGFWASAPDLAKFTALGTANRVATVSPEGAEGKVAYFFQAADFKYDVFGKVGDPAPYSASMGGTNSVGIVRGQLASTSRTISATGQIGSILTLTGPLSTQYVYASLHVFSAGTTLTVIVESATTIGFGSPTTRATIGPITTAGGTFMTRVAGPITDGYWRLSASVITGSFIVAGALGVQ